MPGLHTLTRTSATLAAALLSFAATTWAASLAPPASRVEVVRDTLHGVVIEDPYRWLEDQESPATRQWIDAQNRFTEAVLGSVEPGRAKLRAQLEPLMKVEQTSVPFERGGRYFYSRRGADQELSALCLRRGLDGPEEVVVDPHRMSADLRTTVNWLDVSGDGRLAAYATRSGGEDEVTVTFLDLDTRQPLADQLPKARYFGISISPDRKGIYYSRHGREGSRVFHHAFGTDPANDPMLFGEGYGPGKIVGVNLSGSGRWLQITVSHGSAGDQTEVYVKDLVAGGPITPIVNDVKAQFQPSIAGDRMFLKTNWNAPNGRILVVELEQPARDRWREVVPEGKDAIRSYSAAGGRLFVNYLENVVSRVDVVGVEGKRLGTIRFPALGTVSGVSGDWDKDEAFFTFNSFHIPNTIYRHEVTSGRRSEWWRAPVPIRSERFEVKQVWCTSKDGARVPMFLAHRKGLKLDGARPTLLTGYGGFNLSQTPSFTARAALWMERGGVYAVANLRGGGEFGESWHRAGMLANKQNVFDDFLAAADWLVANRYTRSDRLAISGGSNGGLLVGAALTQRPDRFGAVVCSVPLLDMLRYQDFLVARFWVPEYGSAEDPKQFETLRAYSPYHRVASGAKYPGVLLITGDADTRVAPLHARKMTARLQAATGSDDPVLLYYDTRHGHSRGGKAIAQQLDDLAVELQFLLWQLGVGEDASAAAAN